MKGLASSPLITKFRYIEVLFHIFYYYWGEENHSLYRELHYIEDRYIEVPLYLKVRVAYHVRFTDKMEVLSLQGGGVFLHCKAVVRAQNIVDTFEKLRMPRSATYRPL